MEPEILTKGGLLARGIFAVIIGILCFTLPVGMQAVFAYIIGIFLLIISLVTGAISLSEDGKVHWGILILSIIGVLIALLTFMSPFAMFVAVTILIAAWAITTGIAELAIAYSLKDLPSGSCWASAGSLRSCSVSSLSLPRSRKRDRWS